MKKLFALIILLESGLGMVGMLNAPETVDSVDFVGDLQPLSILLFSPIYWIYAVKCKAWIMT